MSAYRKLTFKQMWMSAFLVLGLLVGVYLVSALYGVGIDKAQQSLRFRFHKGDEVIDETIATAFTAQEQLISLRRDLRDFDKAAASTFGVNHVWPNPASAEHPPRHVREWLRSYPPSEEEQWLIKYSRCVDARNSFHSYWNSLSQRVQGTVSSLPEEATPDRVMDVQLLSRVSLQEAVEDLATQRAVFDEVLEEYQKWKGKETK